MTDEERSMRVPHVCWLGCTIAPLDHFPAPKLWNLRITGQLLGRLRVVLEIPGESDRILHIDRSQLDWFNKLRELRAHDLEAG
jgi:hypothetical protein